MIKLTPAQLKDYDGKNGKPVYLCYKNKVYDVTSSSIWAGGDHWNLHSAGHDLTGEFAEAPHGEEVFERYPMVGALVEEPGKEEKKEVPARKASFIYKSAMELNKLHPHRMMIHFPIALSIASCGLLLLFLATKLPSFEQASYYVQVMALLSVPFAIGTGFLSWKTIYYGKMTRVFSRKILFSIVLAAISLTVAVWRTLDPQIAFSGTHLSWVYILMFFLMTPTVILLGYYGGKITIPS
ncbi:MAG: hypothetical protein M1536_08025 [Firmicutes bacterium]|nr:hypothetical protein [Bacillota bacterium]